MADIERFVRELNAAWREGRFDDLRAFFHDDVVMLPPGGGTPITGVETMVDGYRQFVAHATVHAFDVGRIELFRFDPLVVCHAHFDIDYEIAGNRQQERGTEVYAIVLGDSGPRVVWRTQLSATAG